MQTNLWKRLPIDLFWIIFTFLYPKNLWKLYVLWKKRVGPKPIILKKNLYTEKQIYSFSYTFNPLKRYRRWFKGAIYGLRPAKTPFIDWIGPNIYQILSTQETKRKIKKDSSLLYQNLQMAQKKNKTLLKHLLHDTRPWVCLGDFVYPLPHTLLPDSEKVDSNI